MSGVSNPGLPSATSPAASALAGVSRWPFERIVIGVYLAGLAGRLAWLGVGLLSLARLRRASAPLAPWPSAIDDAVLLAGTDADVRVSSRVVRPVTFGMRRPVVLVPPAFLSFEASQQTAVAAHELLHVARRDWIRTLGDEVILSVFWFHPALWWLVEQIHLSVEQVVDHEVVRLVGARKPYLEALLKLAAAGPTPMLQPASAFLKHGHLAQRVALLVREASMSRLRLVASFAVVLAVLLAGGWVVVQAFPLTAIVRIRRGDAAFIPGLRLRAAADSAAASASGVKAERRPDQRSAAEADRRLEGADGEHRASCRCPKCRLRRRLRRRHRRAGRPPSLFRQTPFDPVVWEKNVQALTLRMPVQPADPTLPYTLGALYWDRVYRDAGLTNAQKQAYLTKGFEALDAALRMKPEYVDALIYKNLLLRSQATIETDPAKQQQLMAQSEKLREQAVAIRNAQSPCAGSPGKRRPRRRQHPAAEANQGRQAGVSDGGEGRRRAGRGDHRRRDRA